MEPAHATRAQIEALNKARVQRIYQEIFTQGKTELVGEFFSAHYIQHMPALPNGPQGVVAFIQEKMALNPRPSITIKHIIAEGDMVAVHAHATPNPDDEFSGQAVFDLFRMENGLIIEHWDIVQAVPKTSTSGNSMFSDLYKAE